MNGGMELMNMIYKIIVMGLIVLMVSGCVTTQTFQEEIQKRDERITSLETELEANESRLDEQEKRLDEVSQTAKDAMTRAEEAGELAKGKFLYEVVLSEDRCKFSINQVTLSDDCQGALDEFIAHLKSQNKDVYIEIQGHTDSMGDPEVNRLIGLKRANAVYEYLATHGNIALHRMNVISYGESEPIADNSTVEGRRMNRRVVLVVLE
ncbi:MAG TPA: OmpA family protein [bacterium]|nr:OmpA family protein [bacterium]